MRVRCAFCGWKYDPLKNKQEVHYRHQRFCSEQHKENHIDDQFRSRARNLKESLQLERDLENGLVGVPG